MAEVGRTEDFRGTVEDQSRRDGTACEDNRCLTKKEDAIGSQRSGGAGVWVGGVVVVGGGWGGGGYKQHKKITNKTKNKKKKNLINKKNIKIIKTKKYIP